MFTNYFCEDWDSTANQDDFIKKYFGKTKVNSSKTSNLQKAKDKFRNTNITKNLIDKAVELNNEHSCTKSHLLKNKHFLNYEWENNVMRKKKKLVKDSSQEYCSKIHSQPQNIQKIEASTSESNNIKKKKNKLVNESISNKSLENSADSNLDTRTDIGNFPAISIKNTDLCSNEIDSNFEKLKKKKKKITNKANSTSEVKNSVFGETETIKDAIFINSDCNNLKIKKKKRKLKKIEESSHPNNFLYEENFTSFENCDKSPMEKNNLPETTNNMVFNHSSVMESNIFRNNSYSKGLNKRKKRIKNTDDSLENDEFFDEAEPTSFENSPDLSVKKSSKLLQNKAYQKLQAAKFRYLNEMLYTNSGKDALSYFQQNTDEFQDYHQGYQSQVSKWPINPVDIIIQEISQINKQGVIADLGCGEAKIAKVFPNRKVHSFDLIALKDCVIACDMTNVPLPSSSVDVVVFCLSLMGTNWKDYLKEGCRILKIGGLMKVAEIESRIDNLHHFTKEIETCGLSLINQNLSHKMFVFLNFRRTNKSKKSAKVPAVTLKPCLYKKR